MAWPTFDPEVNLRYPYLPDIDHMVCVWLFVF